MGASVFIRPVLAIAAVLSFAAPAAATVSVAIDLATQHMHVQSADHTYDWPISSAREGYVTPDGTFAPTQMYVDYHSKKYDNAPMPHAIFFYYGFAIHGTNETRELGKPAVARLRPPVTRQCGDFVRPGQGGRGVHHHYRRSQRPTA